MSKGTYAGVHLNDNSRDILYKFVEEMNIPKPLSKDKYHVTLLYSRKEHPEYEPINYIHHSESLVHTKGFEIFNNRILVLKLDAPQLNLRHKRLMELHEATYDYDEYVPHITLSYDVGSNFDISTLDDYHTSLGLTGEYKEEINLDYDG